MKLPAICSLAFLATAALSHAGSFGGPPPFTDLSPLQSGIDGSYQAAVRGQNTTGVFRFGYQNGVQSPIPTANQYSIFVNGNVVTGSVVAAINGKDLTGTLGGQDFNVPTNENGSVELPLVFVIRGNRANGFFDGHLDLEDRQSSFSGDGELTGAPDETNTVVFIPDVTINSTLGIPDNLVFTNSFVAQGGSIFPETPVQTVPFTFKGVRTSVFAQGTGGSSNSNN